MFALLHTSTFAVRRLSRRGSPLRLAGRLLDMVALHRQRHSLALLDDAMLRDIGLTREEANTEATRPLWDVPRHWKA